MIRLGITGGIGSGKSVICKTFGIIGIPVYYADLRAKELLNSSHEIRTALTKLFGDDLYTEKGIDKAKLANIIFNDKDCLKKVNAIVHPVVINDFEEWTKRQKSDIVVKESAIIFEANLKDQFDYIVTVTAPEDVRIERVMTRDNAKKEDIKARMNNQFPDDKKVSESDFVIVNDGKKAILPQVLNILKTIRK